MGWVKRHNGRLLVHGTGGTVLLPKGANKRKPWRDARGVPLRPDALKEVSKSWDWITWELYLKSLEKGRKEDLGCTEDRAVLVNRFGETEGGGQTWHWDLLEGEPSSRMDTAAHTQALLDPTPTAPKEEVLRGDARQIEPLVADVPEHDSEEEAKIPDPPNLQVEVEKAMQELSASETLVMWLTFWEGRSEREIAVLQNKARRTIRTWKERATKKLREVLSPTFRIYVASRVRSRKRLPLPKWATLPKAEPIQLPSNQRGLQQIH